MVGGQKFVRALPGTLMAITKFLLAVSNTTATTNAYSTLLTKSIVTSRYLKISLSAIS